MRHHIHHAVAGICRKGHAVTTEPELPVEERLYQLLQHLGIERAHFATGAPFDVGRLAATHPSTIASLWSVGADGIEAARRSLGSRIAVLHGDQGPMGLEARRMLGAEPGVPRVVLSDYFHAIWSDVAADRTDEVVRRMLDFLSSPGSEASVRDPLSERAGEVAGITYRIRGAGPPLVLLPLGLAPSQWEPLLPRLSERFSTVTLRGPKVGFAAFLESRATTGMYADLLRALIGDARLEPGEVVLDVGCGTGVLDRQLAGLTGRANPIVGLDVNRYLLDEAAALARSEGLEGIIEFREGDAEALPFADASFNVTLSVTVMEEVNADHMLAEMVRVTRPGGRVGVVVRAVDMPRWVNAKLPAALLAKVQAPAASSGIGPGVAERGCGDASLYGRFVDAGLSNVRMAPRMATASGPVLELFADVWMPSILDADEQQQWRDARALAEAAGTFFIAAPFHCAVGTKP